MSISKAWYWEIAEDQIWDYSSEDVYYYVERWKEKKYRNVLDLGCGIGRNTLLLAKNGFDISGIDLSEFGVNKTKERLLKNGLDGNVICGDIHNLPYGDNSFDALLAYHVISHTDSIGIRKIIGEMNRVVRNKGELYFTLCSKESPTYKNKKYKKVDRNTVLKNEGPEQNIPHFYSNEEEVKEILNGMKILIIRHIKDIFSNTYSWHYFILCENNK